MSVNISIWTKDVKEQLIPDTSFINQAENDDEYVVGAEVKKNQAGGDPNVEMNRSSFPIPVTERADTTLDYSIKEFSTDATVVRNIENIETSYDKRASVIKSHTRALNLAHSKYMTVVWSPTVSTRMVRTSGSSRSAILSGATGTRKRITFDDLLAAKEEMDALDIIPTEGRVLLINPRMMNDLFRSDEIKRADVFGSPNIPKGAVGMILGMAVYMSGVEVRYTEAGTPVPVAYGAATGATNNCAALIWHPSMVSRAKGEVDVFIDQRRAEYQGDIFSAQARLGGATSYTDKRGIVAIIESATS